MDQPEHLGKYRLIGTLKISHGNLAHLSDHCQLHFNQAFLRIMADRLRVADDRFASLLS